jgi:hypothetical protein
LGGGGRAALFAHVKRPGAGDQSSVARLFLLFEGRIQTRSQIVTLKNEKRRRKEKLAIMSLYVNFPLD